MSTSGKGKIVVINNFEQFQRANEDAMDNAVERMTRDVVILAQQTAPHLSGELDKSGEVEKIGKGKYIAWFGKSGDASDYAAAQEVGTTRGYPIRNYTTPGTGAHFLKNAGEKIKSQAMEYLRQAASQIRISKR